MKIRPSSIIALVLLTFTTATNAQPYVEIRGLVTPSAGSTFFEAISFAAVFDTSAAAISNDGSRITFAADDAYYIRKDLSFTPPSSPAPLPNTTTFSVGAPAAPSVQQSIRVDPDTAILEYIISANVWQVRMNLSDGQEFRVSNNSIASAQFNAAMTRLPSSPNEYGDGAALFAAYFHPTKGDIVSIGGSFTDINSGLILYSARTLTSNQYPDPCPGDFTGDGVLDFFDVSAFLQLFQAGCP